MLAVIRAFSYSLDVTCDLTMIILGLVPCFDKDLMLMAQTIGMSFSVFAILGPQNDIQLGPL